MSKKNTLKKVVAAAAVIGTAIHLINRTIIKMANSKNLLKKNSGKYYQSKYGNVFYKVSGEGKPVLLIHDINEASSGMEWFYLEKKLERINKVYTLDLLGCGRSEKPNFIYTNYLYVQLIIDFIKDVIGEKTDIIATGKSSASAIMAARVSPEQIDKLKLINPTDLYELSDIPNVWTKIKKTMITCPVIGTFIYHMTHKKDDIYNQFMNQYFADYLGDFEELSEYYYESAHKDESGSKYLYASLEGNYLNLNINHAIKTLSHDTTILYGEKCIGMDCISKDYRDLNPALKVIPVPNTAYLPQLESPKELMNAILMADKN